MRMQRHDPEIAQEAIEAIYSRRNIRIFVRKAIEQELDSTLVNWANEVELRLELWLEKEHEYESKQKRVDELREHTSLDWLVREIAGAVLHAPNTETLIYQAAAGWLSVGMPHEDVFHRVKTAAELLAIGRDAGLYKIEAGRPHKIVRLHELNEETFGWINQTRSNMPMVCPPRQVSSNKSCGYRELNEPVLMGGPLRQHKEHLSFDVLNLLNQIPWNLDEKVLQEPIVLPEGMDYDQKKLTASFLLEMAHLMQQHGGVFWSPWRYDTRGRAYGASWPLNYQGFEYVRAMFDFAKKEVVT